MHQKKRRKSLTKKFFRLRGEKDGNQFGLIIGRGEPPFYLFFFIQKENLLKIKKHVLYKEYEGKVYSKRVRG
ncbi:hypothetical protein A2442_02410 [Candidatus Campbellbacteria bacterium RIFOXYC2_FULL_35_25]|uniref:Uncharacterized protein n=1 Tax=Candidatus Campbellbacteria bacterium RIFOXYC2_FULL_35_25 TaxID=1797582 RepID=A0A1F5EK45_9BACT|nr:MAG: hypothetical protein A2442_02410 [Candidatus Campbellbacteria bacterium RIFOXYC2_FULL_35_25]